MLKDSHQGSHCGRHSEKSNILHRTDTSYFYKNTQAENGH